MNKTQKSVATHADVENSDEGESKETEIVEELRTTEAQGGPCHQIVGGTPETKKYPGT